MDPDGARLMGTRTGIRSGIAPAYLKHLRRPDGKALGGHRLGRWAAVEDYSPDLDLDACDAAFKRQGGDGLCASCRRVADRLRREGA